MNFLRAHWWVVPSVITFVLVFLAMAIPTYNHWRHNEKPTSLVIWVTVATVLSFIVWLIASPCHCL